MWAADDADDLRLDAEMAERLNQLAADHLMVARIGALVAFAFFQHLGRRRPVVDLLGFGDPALVAHRGQGHGLGLRKVRGLRLRLGSELLGKLGEFMGCRLRVIRLLGDRHRRLEVVVLRVSAHHVGGAGLGLEGGGLFAAALLAMLERGLGDVATAGEGVADATAKATEDGRDGGARDQHDTDCQHQHGRDPRPDAAEQIVEPGFEAVADLAAIPAEEEDEAEIDAGGDQEEPDQVEVALLQPFGQMRPRELGFGFRPCLWACGARRTALLAHEHEARFDAGCPSPARRPGTTASPS